MLDQPKVRTGAPGPWDRGVDRLQRGPAHAHGRPVGRAGGSCPGVPATCSRWSSTAWPRTRTSAAGSSPTARWRS